MPAGQALWGRHRPSLQLLHCLCPVTELKVQGRGRLIHMFQAHLCRSERQESLQSRVQATLSLPLAGPKPPLECPLLLLLGVFLLPSVRRTNSDKGCLAFHPRYTPQRGHCHAGEDAASMGRFPVGVLPRPLTLMPAICFQKQFLAMNSSTGNPR